jgi:hypothetical protein
MSFGKDLYSSLQSSGPLQLPFKLI